MLLIWGTLSLLPIPQATEILEWWFIIFLGSDLSFGTSSFKKKMTLMSYLVQNQRMRCFHSFQLRVTKLSCFSAPVEVNQFLWTVLRTSAAAAAKSLQSCKTLCDPINGSPPGSPVPGILQARTLEWVAISFSNAWKWKVKVKSFNHVWLFTTPWTAAYQALPSMGLFS